MIDRNKIVKIIFTLLGIVMLAAGISYIVRRNSMTLEEYAREYPKPAYGESSSEDSGKAEGDSSENPDQTEETSLEDSGKASAQGENTPAASETQSNQGVSSVGEPSQADGGAHKTDGQAPEAVVWELTGEALNRDSMIDQRTTYADGFYYEPISAELAAAMEGVSYPAPDTLPEDPAIGYEDLSYVHLLHYDFDGNIAEGELICNNAIAQDFVEIFYELYKNMYRIEKIRLIDEYGGDDTASMEDNNTSCFNYRTVEGSASLSKHALGLAIDINPFYNPYVTYPDGQVRISPQGSEIYADRSQDFPYKIDENDLCYKLFTQRGFIWGGNWNGMKDYQHFQKALE